MALVHSWLLPHIPKRVCPDKQIKTNSPLKFKVKISCFKELESSVPKNCYVPSLREIGPVVLKKIFKMSSKCFCYFAIISPFGIGVSLYLNKFVSPSSKGMLSANFVRNWPTASGKEDFLNWVRNIFCYFAIISHWKRMWPFIWTNLNPIHPRTPCSKFGWKLVQWFWPMFMDSWNVGSSLERNLWVMG